MNQALKDLEQNDESDIQITRATLEFQHENQVSPTRNDNKVIKCLIIILTVIIKIVIFLIIWIKVDQASDQEIVRNRTVTSTENLFDDSTENLTDLVDIPVNDEW